MPMVKSKYDVISGLYDGSMKLSHSALNAFQKSPRHFIEYKTGEREQTPAMLFGSLVHCMVLEPDEVESRYIQIPEDAPRRPSDRQRNAKNPSDSTIESIAFWDEWERKAEGKGQISADDWEAAERMKDAIYSNDASRFVLDMIDQTEVHIEWTFKGFQWHGYIDGKGEKIIMDLKTIRDATPRFVERAIKYDGYARQAAHYTIGAGNKDCSYYVVAVDKNCHVTTCKLRKTTLKAAWEEIEILTGMFRKCLALDEWGKSYDFWAHSAGIYEV